MVWDEAVAHLLSAAPLRLYLFGRFRLESDQGPILLSTRKIEALLAYLVLHPGPHSREKLAALLWGDFTDAQARASLRNALAVLRKQLGDNLLLSDRDTTQLNPSSPLWVDALEFRTQATASMTGSLANPALVRVELYQADLLTDFYEDWVLAEREYYHRLYLDTLLHLIQQMRSTSEYKQAISLAERLLASDPTHEPTHQNLMACYLALGNRHAALRQYEMCRRILHDELDVEPQLDTTALYERIKRTPASQPSPAASLTNLPSPLTSFIGREREIAEVKRLLSPPVGRGVGASPERSRRGEGAITRLLTLTGPGGGGKTRLAIEAAHHLVDAFEDGVWWADLGAVADPAFVSQAVAKVLGLREGVSQSLSEMLINHLRPKRLLLVLDNCEHLVVACAQLVETLLRACPRLQVLATSREALGLIGEHVWPVPPLSLPNPYQPLSLDKVRQGEAARLFVDRTVAISSDFELTEQNISAVAQVCQRLEGIPLAIELAAVWVRVLTVEQIASRLADRFTLLTLGSRTALPRHQTLRAALDWSYDLLTEAEQSLFRQLSVFVGGFTLEAVETVIRDWTRSVEIRDSTNPQSLRFASNLELLTQLVNKSFVLVDHQAEEARYRLLEPIRQYGEDKLWLLGEEAALRRRHLHWCRQLAEQTEPELLGPNQTMWLDRLEREYANLSAALRWSAEGEPVDVEAGLRLGGALWRFWDLRGYIGEGRERLMRLLTLPSAAEWTEAQAKALFSAGMLSLYQMDSQTAAGLLAESLALWRESDHKPGIALALQHLGFIAHRLGQYSVAHTRYEESLAVWREIGRPWGLAETLGMLGNLTYWERDYVAAHSLQTESLTVKRQWGEKRGIAFSVWSLGKVAHAQGDYRAARSLYEEALDTMRQLEDKGGIPFVLEAFGYLAVTEGQLQRAARLLGAAETLRQITGSALPVVSRADHNREVASIHHHLGEEGFATAWAEGRVMTLDQAIDYALQL